MAENSIYGLTTKVKEDHILTAEYGEVPTFDGKLVEIKDPDEKHISEVIDSLKACNICKCDDCYLNLHSIDENCTDRLRSDAAKLLEKYKSCCAYIVKDKKDEKDAT